MLFTVFLWNIAQDLIFHVELNHFAPQYDSNIYGSVMQTEWIYQHISHPLTCKELKEHFNSGIFAR